MATTTITKDGARQAGMGWIEYAEDGRFLDEEKEIRWGAAQRTVGRCTGQEIAEAVQRLAKKRDPGCVDALLVLEHYLKAELGKRFDMLDVFATLLRGY